MNPELLAAAETECLRRAERVRDTSVRVFDVAPDRVGVKYSMLPDGDRWSVDLDGEPIDEEQTRRLVAALGMPPDTTLEQEASP